MSETTELDNSDDQYASSKVEICEQCNLPKMIVTYEVGFKIIQQQLIDLRKDLQALVNRIDTLDRRTLSNTSSQRQ